MIVEFLSDINSEFKLPGNRNKIKHCFKLMRDAMDKTKKDAKNKTPNSENNSTCCGCLCSLNMIERKINLKDKRISIPFKR